MPSAKLDRNAMFQPVKDENALKKMEADLLARATLDAERSTAVPFKLERDMELPKKCLSDFKKSLQELQDIDVTIATSFAVATTTFWLVPMQVVSLMSSLLCLRNFHLRSNAVEKQQQSLKNLLMCWDWAMNRDGSEQLWQQIKTESEAAKQAGTEYHNVMLEMLEALYPFVTEADFKEITANAIEQELIKIGDASKDHITFKNYKVDRKQVELMHDMYGYQQEGGLMTFLKSLMHAFPSAATNLFNTVVKFYNTMNTVAEAAPTPAP